MTLEEALAKIVELENNITTLNSTIEAHNTEKETFEADKEKLSTEVTRLQKRNLEFFNALETQRVDIIENKGQQKTNVDETKEEVLNIDDVAKAFI